MNGGSQGATVMIFYWHNILPNFRNPDGLQRSLPPVGMTIRSVFRERGKEKGAAVDNSSILDFSQPPLFLSRAPLYQKRTVISTGKPKRQLWVERRDPSLAPFVSPSWKHCQTHPAAGENFSPAPLKSHKGRILAFTSGQSFI